jgi:hypothetical protein
MYMTPLEILKLCVCLQCFVSNIKYVKLSLVPVFVILNIFFHGLCKLNLMKPKISNNVFACTLHIVMFQLDSKQASYLRTALATNLQNKDNEKT